MPALSSGLYYDHGAPMRQGWVFASRPNPEDGERPITAFGGDQESVERWTKRRSSSSSLAAIPARSAIL
jgi:hypothetical protein